MGVKFYMFFDALRKQLLVSLPEEKVIIKFNPKEKPLNFTLVAGKGDGCRGNGLCGDGGPATKARLMYPKVMIKVFDILST